MLLGNFMTQRLGLFQSRLVTQAIFEEIEKGMITDRFFYENAEPSACRSLSLKFGNSQLNFFAAEAVG